MRHTVAELDAVDRLMMTAYNSSSRRRELRLYLSVQPDGWFVISNGDEIFAAAGAIAYGPFCWLGLVATDPARRGRGLATKLSAHIIEWARQRGYKTVALDASVAGLAASSRPPRDDRQDLENRSGANARWGQSRGRKER